MIAQRLSAVLAAVFVAMSITACGEKQDKPASQPAPAASAPAPTPPSAEAPKPGTPEAAPVLAPIGKIDALEGEVRVVDSRGARRVQAGTELLEGDTIRVGAEGWALLAMSDGASVTMRSNSELRFDNYRHAPDGDAKENSAVLSLTKGALRSITGYIGQVNPVAYQVRTPTATIGIRGTDHEPAYYPPPAPGEKQDHEPGTYDKVNEGESVIRRPTGEVAVRRGQTAFAPQDVKVRPQLLSTPPVFYQRHAQLDTKVAERRAEFHRQFQEQQQRRQQERRQQQEALKREQEQRKDRQQEQQQRRQQEQKDRQQEQKDRRQQQQKDKKEEQKKSEELQKQKDKESKTQQEKRRESRAEEQKKRQVEQKAKDESKAALPPAVAERIKRLQGGDKKASPTPAPAQSPAPARSPAEQIRRAFEGSKPTQPEKADSRTPQQQRQQQRDQQQREQQQQRQLQQQQQQQQRELQQQQRELQRQQSQQQRELQRQQSQQRQQQRERPRDQPR